MRTDFKSMIEYSIDHKASALWVRAILLSGSMCLSVIGSAQMWCPAGAQWHHAINTFGFSGYIIRTYIGDTVINGWEAQRIHEYRLQIQEPLNDTTITETERYTSLQDSTVYLWTMPALGPGEFQWDTLFRFNAVVGDRWYPPGADDFYDNGCAGMAEVLDIGTVVIEGVQLRTLDVGYCSTSGEPPTLPGGYQIIERIGSMVAFVLMPLTVLGDMELFQCYTDDEISYSHPQWPEGCDIITGYTQSEPNIQYQVYPNPGSSYLHIRTNPASFETIVTIRSLQGEVVYHSSKSGAIEVISIVNWPNGIYLIEVLDPLRGSWFTRWIKV